METLRRLIQFIKDSRNEFKKVSWPTRQDVIDSTIGVVISVLVLVAMFAIFDEIVGRLMDLLLRK